jgi:hypothetical protein
MYTNQSKVYYITLVDVKPGAGSSAETNIMDLAFINEATYIIADYKVNNFLSYDTEFLNLIKLQIANPLYYLSPISNTISELIKLVNDLNNIKLDLENQINIGFRSPNGSNLTINATSKNIEQNSSIKLLYVQYLLMYDLQLTNGVFIDSYLTNAAAVLAANGNSLVIDYLQNT